MVRRRFVVLDGWRGLCALLVALAHADFLGHFYFWPVVRNGHLFVDFFFVLSGYTA
jgi:peptidoglycan/LPS O-acetylase OafA/YrhL